jgi:hypothetical protein
LSHQLILATFARFVRNHYRQIAVNFSGKFGKRVHTPNVVNQATMAFCIATVSKRVPCSNFKFRQTQSDNRIATTNNGWHNQTALFIRVLSVQHSTQKQKYYDDEDSHFAKIQKKIEP